MQLNDRQEKIVEIVKAHGPITGEKVAEQLNLTRASLRPDLAFLTQIGLLDARPRVGYYYKGAQNPFGLMERITDMTVGAHQSVPVTVKENTSVYDAIVSMFVNDVGTLFVVNDNQVSIRIFYNDVCNSSKIMGFISQVFFLTKKFIVFFNEHFFKKRS